MIIAEIGVDMTRFPTPAHLCLVGQVRARRQGVRRPQEGQRLPPATATATWPGSWARPPSAVGRTDTFLGERYRRIARRRGKKRAIVAVGRSILVIIWHLLTDPDSPVPRPRHRLLRHTAAAPNAPSATTSANSRPSATGSPSNPPPDPTAAQHMVRLRRAPSACPLTIHFRISLLGPWDADAGVKTRGGLPCRRRRSLGLRGCGLAWRWGFDLLGYALLLRARRSDFRFPTEAPGHPASMRAREERGDAGTSRGARR